MSLLPARSYLPRRPAFIAHFFVGFFLLRGPIKASAEEAANAVASRGFQRLLTDAGIAAADLQQFEQWDGALTAEQQTLFEQILFRLEQLQRGELRIPAGIEKSKQAAGPGDLAHLSGTAVAFSALDSSLQVEGDTAHPLIWQTAVTSEDGKQIAILSPRIPQKWHKRTAGEPLNEPIAATAIRLGSLARDNGQQELYLASRLQWRPTTGVPSGLTWLARQGFDVALLDEVRQNSSFARPQESLEATAFYSCLATMARGNAAELTRLARQSVVDSVDHWRRQEIAARDRRQEIMEELEAAVGDKHTALESELATVQQRQALAHEVLERAKLGLSSSYPMFIEPRDNVGALQLIEGTARRAVRIVVDEDQSTPRRYDAMISASTADGAAPPPGVREYYELDVFTTDAPKNHPIICCVARLPEGFPTGDFIREPVRVAGVFFKKWAYARRPEVEPNLKDPLPERLAPSLIIAAKPEWLRTAEPLSSSRGLGFGLMIALTLAVVWLVLVRTARRDRLARQRQARYDAPLEPLAEP